MIDGMRASENKSVIMLRSVLVDIVRQADNEESTSKRDKAEPVPAPLDIEGLHYRMRFIESLVNTLQETIEDIHETIDESR